MTQPSRPSPATEGTVTESQGPPDQTVPHADTLAAEAPSANPDAPAFAPPEHAGEVGKLGRYRVLKELGRGGMGAVYLGYDSALDRKVALKVMLPNHAASRDARERFLREARTAATVRSEHVVTIFDVAEERGIPFIAMQYLLGHSLDQYLKTRGELPLVHVLRVGRETALGLAAAHELGLIHRDVKPANLWLEAPKGRVKLLDFGLARAENDDVHLTNTGAVVGTPAYMSPEQGRGEKVDHRTDLFSLGVLLYRLTTGRAPFRGANTMAILTSLAVDTPAPVRQLNPNVPEALESLITRLLAKNPDERIQTAMEVVVALREIEQPKSVSGPLPVVVPLQSVPMAITAQTQNVWEGIDDSESAPVPLATSAETEADPAPAPKPARKQPERKASKLPLILAGVGLLAAVAVLAAVMGPKKTNPPVVENAEPEKPAPPDRKQPPVAAPDPDRTAAEWVISLGGGVRVNGEEKDITAAADLPKDHFWLTYVYIYDAAQKVTDAGLANFKDCKNLTTLRLRNMNVTDAGLAYFKDLKSLAHLELGNTQVGDAGLVHFKDCKNLTILNLSSTRVGGAGLVHFKDCKNLTELHLSFTQVGDAGLAHFKDCKKLSEVSLFGTGVTDAGLAHLTGCKQLTLLNLQGTKITPPAIEAFNKALPQCKIILPDGKTIEAKDIEREVTAELLGRAGSGLVVIVPEGREIKVTKAAEIPPGPFAIDAINVKSPFTDADLKRLEPLRRLRVLNLLRGHTISTEGLRAVLAHKSTLDWLRLDDAPVSDEGLKVVGQLSELTVLGLNDTKATNDGLKYLTGLTKLLGLELENAPVTDAAIETLAEMKSLVELTVKGTKLTEPALKKLAEKLPGCKITHDKGVIEPTADRKAAEYVLSVGGTVGVNGEGSLIKGVGELPKERFTLTHANFGYGNVTVTDEGLVIFKDCKHLESIVLGAAKVGDRGLAHFQNCKSLTELSLRETHVTDDGLAHFKDCKQLRSLDLGSTKITDAGLSHFKDCKKLSQLILHATGVGDKGMANFRGCKDLTHVGLWATQVSDGVLDQLKECKQLVSLDVRGTKVTAAKVAEFRKALPKCEVIHESVEPKK